MNGTFAINKGLRIARNLLLDIAEMGLPTACEFLDTISPQVSRGLGEGERRQAKEAVLTDAEPVRRSLRRT